MCYYYSYKKMVESGKCIFDVGCICSLYSKNTFENVKKIQKKKSCVHLDRLGTYDQVSRYIDIYSVLSKKTKKVSRKLLFLPPNFVFFA
jgi:hypothetical protein